MKKRGAIEMQFNWVFVFIVGSVILLFFFAIVQRQRSVSESKLAATIITDLEAITSGAAVSKGTAQTIPLPKIGIEFDCTDCLCRYSLGRSSKQFRDRIIFAPTRIEARSMIAWTLDWSVPFRMANFVFLSSKTSRYIIYSDPFGASPAEEEFIQEIPSDFNVDRISDDSTPLDENNPTVTFVYFGESPNDLHLDNIDDMKDDDVRALEVDFNANRVTFYKKDGVRWSDPIDSAFFLEKESLYGAMFSGTPDIYRCNMQQAFNKMRIVTDIYINRTEKMQKYYVLDTTSRLRDCDTRGFYLDDNNKLQQLRQAADDLSTDISTSDAQGYMTRLLEARGAVIRQNNKAQLYSCPEIY